MPAQTDHEIDIVGTIDPSRGIDTKAIESALASDRRGFVHGEVFTGRPATHVYSDDSHVVKIRSELKFSETDARRWIERHLEKERAYRVHHPAKTWFLLRDPAAQRAMIANVTPRLNPLHTLLPTLAEAVMLEHLTQVFELYFRFAADHEKHLDEGLSNFGIDAHGTVFYLDDDIYTWNDLASLSNTLGVWVRQLETATPEAFAQLGRIIREKIEHNFRDPHWATVIAEQLRDLFTGNDAQRRKLDALIGALYPPRASRGRQGTTGTGKTARTRSISAGTGSSEDSRLALLADVHANLPALEATLEFLDGVGVSQGIVLGDIVGYGPHPAECIELLRSSGFSIIKGNHDHATAIGEARQGFSAMSRWVIDWTIETLSDEQRRWLADLPVFLRDEDWLAVHGAPQDRTFFNGYVYRLTYEDNLDNLQTRAIRMCFHGHTHVQRIYYRADKQDAQFDGERFRLADIDYALVCPGAVGQPRSGKAGAEFAILDSSEDRIDFMRIDYDIDRTVRDLNRLKFPPQLATRLLAGK